MRSLPIVMAEFSSFCAFIDREEITTAQKIVGKRSTVNSNYIFIGLAYQSIAKCLIISLSEMYNMELSFGSFISCFNLVYISNMLVKHGSPSMGTRVVMATKSNTGNVRIEERP